MKNYIFCFISILLIKYCSAQHTVTVFSKKLILTADDKLICSYGQNGDSTFSYLKISKDSIFVHVLDKKNGVYIRWSYCSAALASVDPVLSRVIEIGLNDNIVYPKAGIVQVITKDYKESMFYHMVDDKRDTTLYSSSLNLICCDLKEAVYWRWKIARLINPSIPNREVSTTHEKFSLPSIPLFYSKEKDRFDKYYSYHRYYEIKNDTVYCYLACDLIEWDNTCWYMTLEKAPLKMISKANMVVRKVRPDEYENGPEKDAYSVAIGTPGKFIVTHVGNGKNRFETQQAMMLIICANKEMADAVFNEILKAQKKN